MLNINAPRANRSRGSEDARKAAVEEIRGHMSVFRTAAQRARVRRLLQQSISLTHLHVLVILQADGSLPVGELARSLDVSVASATGIVSRMEERGLVERRRSELDRRVVVVKLAKAGRAILDQNESRQREHFAALLARLTPGELETVRKGFAALHRVHDAQMAASGSAAKEVHA